MHRGVQPIKYCNLFWTNSAFFKLEAVQKLTSSRPNIVPIPSRIGLFWLVALAMSRAILGDRQLEELFRIRSKKTPFQSTLLIGKH